MLKLVMLLVMFKNTTIDRKCDALSNYNVLPSFILYESFIETI